MQRCIAKPVNHMTLLWKASHDIQQKSTKNNTAKEVHRKSVVHITLLWKSSCEYFEYVLTKIELFALMPDRYRTYTVVSMMYNAV